MKKILVVFGTRPEAIKLAPVVKALEMINAFQVTVCSTGQHREMLHQVIDLFDIGIDLDLDLMQPNQSLFDITTNSLQQMNLLLDKYRPDLVIVQGDTSTAFVTALAAFYKKIKVAHVEAGLRSYNLFHPYPEEANRRFISVLSDFNFAPTNKSAQNLIREGFTENKIFVTGNTVVDALFEIKMKLENPEISNKIINELINDLGTECFKRPFILITLHRREKFGSELKELLVTIKLLAEKYLNLNFIYPIHLNPNVFEPVKEILSRTSNIYLTAPLDYLKFLYLMSKCRFIMSDSGGVQEECYVFSKPIIVMRNVTEREEAVEAGYAFLTGSERAKIFYHFDDIDKKLADGYNFFPAENPFGDGNSSKRISEILKAQLI